MSIERGPVIHLASGDLWGGAEALVLALAREQHRVRPGGVHCVVMNPGELEGRLTDCGVPTTVLNECRQGVFTLHRQIQRVIHRLDPSVLHAHRQKENFLATLARSTHATWRRHLPVVATVHGLPEPVEHSHWFRRGLVGLLDASVCRFGIDALVGVSSEIAGNLKARFPQTCVVTIHNGVAIPFLTLPARRPTLPNVRLLALGRLVSVKRFDRLLHLSRVLETRGLRSTITLAGDGPLRVPLRELLAPDSPGSPFDMPGFVCDTTSLLHSSDALVMTSDQEGIPMAVLEALALGIPVFAFGVGGLPEIAAPDVPLHLVSPGDTEALAQEIWRYFTHFEAEPRTAMPEDWSFDIRVCAKAYDRLYASL